MFSIIWPIGDANRVHVSRERHAKSRKTKERGSALGDKERKKKKGEGGRKKKRKRTYPITQH